MRFLDALKEYLRGVERGVAPERVAPVEIDLPTARRYFFEALEGREKIEASHPDSARLVRLVRNTEFIEGIASQLREGLCAGSPRADLQQHVHLAIDHLLEATVAGVSQTRRSELKRIVDRARRSAEHRDSHTDVERYAFELRLVRFELEVRSISPIGKVFLGLPESDAIAWLLTLEVQQSFGLMDLWRMPAEEIEYVHRHPNNEPADRTGNHGASDLRAIYRLGELGVIDYWEDNEEAKWGYELYPAFKPLIEDLAARKRTPLYVLAETLIADERDSLPSRVLPSTLPPQSAAEIQARHARMVVHEIRNALVPVRLALSTLYEGLDATLPTEPMTRSRERIDRGVERVFRFIDEMGRVAQLGVIAPSPFDVVEAVRDAVKGLNGGIQLDTSITADEGLDHVLGYRDRFTLAVVNLLRNAAQSSLKARAAVHLTAVLSASRDRVIVTIDDDGPGVPEESREDIFQQGFALRAGGSGQGLALVREVVEVEMKGQVRCERGDLGGARFVLALPTALKERA